MALQNPSQLDLLKPIKSKYRNKIFQDADGVTWHSRAEFNRYRLLKVMESHGKIRNLKRQVSFRLDVNGHRVCRYVADFTYVEDIGGVWAEVVEDVKSKPTKTRLYEVKRELMLAIHRISIREITS